MPFTIVRNNITEMQVDAIVNTTNPEPAVGHGVDFAIHQKAGPQLLEARKQLGFIPVGEAALTPAFDLTAKAVVHTVCPQWEGGEHQEAALLRQCYDRALTLACQHHYRSIAFPLLATGNLGFPKDLALQIAVEAFSRVLLKHDLQIYLVVFTHDAVSLSQKLVDSVQHYIDEHYVCEQFMAEYELDAEDYCFIDTSEKIDLDDIITQDAKEKDCVAPLDAAFRLPIEREREVERRALHSEKRCLRRMSTAKYELIHPKRARDGSKVLLEDLLQKLDLSFSDTLMKLIKQSGKKETEVYKRANIDRKLFSKIRSNHNYKPSKTTAVAFAIALELDLSATKDLLARAGFSLSHCNKFDIIVEYFINNQDYDIYKLNEVLFTFDQPLLGV